LRSGRSGGAVAASGPNGRSLIAWTDGHLSSAPGAVACDVVLIAAGRALSKMDTLYA
jgi:hypothetical protein